MLGVSAGLVAMTAAVGAAPAIAAPGHQKAKAVKVVRDLDRDGIRNAHDRDRDGDGIPNVRDARPNQPDRNHGRIGVGWGVRPYANTRPYTATRYANDMDRDGIANAWDRDRDGDGVRNARDRFPNNVKRR
jgi:hypothetical protein